MKKLKKILAAVLAIGLILSFLTACDGSMLERKNVLIENQAGVKITFLSDRTHTSADGQTLFVVLDIEDTTGGQKQVLSGLRFVEKAFSTECYAQINGVEIPVSSYTLTNGIPGADHAARTWITVKASDLKEKGIEVKDVKEVKTKFRVRSYLSYRGQLDFGEWQETAPVTIKL